MGGGDGVELVCYALMVAFERWGLGMVLWQVLCESGGARECSFLSWWLFLCLIDLNQV